MNLDNYTWWKKPDSIVHYFMIQFIGNIQNKQTNKDKNICSFQRWGRSKVEKWLQMGIKLCNGGGDKNYESI